MSIKFNSQACIITLRAALGMALYKAAKMYIEEVKGGMQTPEGADSVQDISLDDVGVVAGAVAVTVTGGAWAAMDNYGTGSLMDRTNPALLGYMMSGLWNPTREGYAIVGRPTGWYKNIFGESVYSRGTREGQNLEGVKLRFKKTIEPMPPSLAFQIAAKWMENYLFARVVKDVLNEFSFDPFFIALP